MENPTWRNTHPNFNLNGAPYTIGELSEIGYDLVKEGDPFEIPLGEFLLDWISDRPTIEVFTSGSTGKPKKIVLKKEQMVNSAKATGAYFGLKPGNTALLCLPSSGIAGKMMLVRAMVLGLQLDYVEPSSTPMENNAKSYDFVAMVPLQVQNSLQRLSQIKTLIIGGASIDSTLKKKLYVLPTHVYETYGMTETITHIAVKKVARKSADYFETLPGVSISVDDRGCLVIKAPNISDVEVVTNDLVEMVDKRHFIWLGRFDAVINSGGIKLVPEQIERKLAPVIASRFFVAGIPDETFGQRLVLVVEETDCDKDALLQKIKALQDIGKYEVPKEVFCVKSFVETKSGKIQRGKTLLQIG
ncbi:MAG: AMP-binding protein [Allomuricauda sp.]